jgi:hypothetical protein
MPLHSSRREEALSRSCREILPATSTGPAWPSSSALLNKPNTRPGEVVHAERARDIHHPQLRCRLHRRTPGHRLIDIRGSLTKRRSGPTRPYQADLARRPRPAIVTLRDWRFKARASWPNIYAMLSDGGQWWGRQIICSGAARTATLATRLPALSALGQHETRISPDLSRVAFAAIAWRLSSPPSALRRSAQPLQMPHLSCSGSAGSSGLN